LPIALCYSEAASRVDQSGGPYVYASSAFGPGVGFAVGWMCFANAVFSFAAVASAAAAYFGRLAPGFSALSVQKLVALVVIAVFAWLNYRGAKPGARAVDTFTIAKFAVLIVLVSVLLPGASFSHLDTTLPNGVAGIGSATFVALFAAQGFEVAPVAAGETHAPQRVVPIAVVLSLLAASLLYLFVQTTLVGAYPHLGQVSDTPLADAALAVAPALGIVITAGGLVSMLGFVSGSALGTPRYLYAAALDGHLPHSLTAVHTRYESPHRAIVATGVLAGVLVLPFDYRSLIGMSNVSVAVQYLATCLAVLQLRRRDPKPAAFRVAGGPVLPVIGALISASIFTQASFVELSWAFASLVVGLLAVTVSRRFGRPVPPL
jgi:APA family basic amino acid/polyamine antiporter